MRPKTKTTQKCIECGSVYEAHLCKIKRHRRFCTPKCYYDSLRGKQKEIKPIEEHSWLINDRGYLFTTVRAKRILQHRWIAECKIIKRPLLKKEIVHYLNGIKTDNRPENLAVCTKRTYAEYIYKLNKRIQELETITG